MYQAVRGTTDILPQEQACWRFVEQKAADIQTRLDEIDTALSRLGHPGAGYDGIPRQSEGTYSLNYHIRGLPDHSRELALRLHTAILDLPNTQPKFNKHHIAYSTLQRFAMMIPQKRKMVLLIRADVSTEDPEIWTRDARSRGLGFERTFDLGDADGIEYAMRLIRRSYDLVSKRAM